MVVKGAGMMQNVFRFILAAGLWLVFTAQPALALDVKSVRIGTHPDKTRLVLELNEMSKFRVFALQDPWRLVIDMPSFNWQAGQISNPAGSVVADIRQGELKPGFSRVVVSLKKPAAVRDAFLLRGKGASADRLVVDFQAVSAAEFARGGGKVFGLLDPGPSSGGAEAAAASSRGSAAVPSAVSAPVPAPPVPAPPPRARFQEASFGAQALPGRKPVPAAPHEPLRKPVIIIDAGHGGADSGAIGVGGVLEKNVTLAMARELKRQLESTGRYNVRLTRDKDSYLRLYRRVDLARAAGGDLFISLHADSIGKSNVHGASVYTLSEKASDEQTAMLADRENRSDLIAGVDLSTEDADVANILVDLAMRDTMNQSNFFAGVLVDSLQGAGIGILEKAHRQAGFAVLKAPDMPSVLIEIGFMSNAREVDRLVSPEYRGRLGQALVSGIDSYFEKVRKNQRI